MPISLLILFIYFLIFWVRIMFIFMSMAVVFFYFFLFYAFKEFFCLVRHRLLLLLSQLFLDYLLFYFIQFNLFFLELFNLSLDFNEIWIPRIDFFPLLNATFSGSKIVEISGQKWIATSIRWVIIQDTWVVNHITVVKVYSGFHVALLEILQHFIHLFVLFILILITASVMYFQRHRPDHLYLFDLFILLYVVLGMGF